MVLSLKIMKPTSFQQLDGNIVNRKLYVSLEGSHVLLWLHFVLTASDVNLKFTNEWEDSMHAELEWRQIL